MDQHTHYGLVRIVQLLHPPEAYDGWRLNRRPPQVGDIATIVEIRQAAGLPTTYILESCAPDGTTIWLGDFDAAEIVPADERV